MKTSPVESVQHLGVGIDTARYGHHVSFMDRERRFIDSGLTISESADGYQRLRKKLEQLHSNNPNAHFHIHLDAAGQYATNLEQYIRGLHLPMTLSIGEPKRNKDYHRAISPKRKSDISESQAMARFGAIERPADSPQIPQEIVTLREIAGRLEGQVKSGTQAINRLHNLLSRVFPELAKITANVASAWLLTLLQRYPTPERISRAALSSLAKIPHVGQTKAEQLQAAAKETVGSLHGESVEKLVRHAVEEVQHALQGQKVLEKRLTR